jgi:hypothetical protein
VPWAKAVSYPFTISLRQSPVYKKYKGRFFEITILGGKNRKGIKEDGLVGKEYKFMWNSLVFIGLKTREFLI